MDTNTTNNALVTLIGRETLQFRSFPEFREGDNTGHGVHYTGTLTENAVAMAAANAQAHGVFVQVQPETGGTDLVFVDDDRGFLPRTAEGLVDVAALPYPPALVVRTRNGHHVYWRLSKKVNKQEYPALMQRLAQGLRTDPQVSDWGRVMRLPGFQHRKGEPFDVTTEHSSPASVVDFDKFLNRLPALDTSYGLWYSSKFLTCEFGGLVWQAQKPCVLAYGRLRRLSGRDVPWNVEYTAENWANLAHYALWLNAATNAGLTNDTATLRLKTILGGTSPREMSDEQAQILVSDAMRLQRDPHASVTRKPEEVAAEVAAWREGQILGKATQIHLHRGGTESLEAWAARHPTAGSKDQIHCPFPGHSDENTSAFVVRMANNAFVSCSGCGSKGFLYPRRADAAPKASLPEKLAAHGYDDVNAGKRMAAALKPKLARDRGRWLRYDGMRWSPNDEMARTEFLLAQEQMIADTRSFIAQEGDADAIDAAKKFVTYMSSNAGGKAVTAQARDRLDQAPDKLDVDPFTLNTPSGEVDLKTGTLRPHDYLSWCSHLTPHGYDEHAIAPTWEKFMFDIMPDQDTRRFLQRFAGYCLTGDVSGQVFVVLYGQGANGKSVFTNVIQKILGDYAATMDPDVLLGDYSGHLAPLMRLRGLRLAVTSELRAGSRLNVSLIKRITGGEPITANAMRQDPIEFLPSHKTVLVTNDKPALRQTDQGDYGLWRRMRMVEFSQTFAQNPVEGQGKLDPDMESKLMREAPGILAWAVRGLKELISLGFAQGLLPSPKMEELVTEYREDADLIKEFLDECTYPLTTGWVKKRDLYDRYVEYCKAHNAHPMSMQTLTELFKSKRKLLIEKKDSAGSRQWYGIGLHPSLSDPTWRAVRQPGFVHQELDLTNLHFHVEEPKVH